MEDTRSARWAWPAPTRFGGLSFSRCSWSRRWPCALVAAVRWPVMDGSAGERGVKVGAERRRRRRQARAWPRGYCILAGALGGVPWMRRETVGCWQCRWRWRCAGGNKRASGGLHGCGAQQMVRAARVDLEFWECGRRPQRPAAAARFGRLGQLTPNGGKRRSRSRQNVFPARSISILCYCSYRISMDSHALAWPCCTRPRLLLAWCLHTMYMILRLLACSACSSPPTYCTTYLAQPRPRLSPPPSLTC